MAVSANMRRKSLDAAPASSGFFAMRPYSHWLTACRRWTDSAKGPTNSASSVASAVRSSSRSAWAKNDFRVRPLLATSLRPTRSSACTPLVPS